MRPRRVQTPVRRDRAENYVLTFLVAFAVTGGRLNFDTWERIFYGEFDGQRRKRVLVRT